MYIHIYNCQHILNLYNCTICVDLFEFAEKANITFQGGIYGTATLMPTYIYQNSTSHC